MVAAESNGPPHKVPVGRVDGWTPQPWVVSAEPPPWLRARVTAEAWPAGTVSQWRRNLRGLNIHSVYAIYTQGQLTGIELDGAFQEIDQHHPAPIDHALRECAARLKVAQKPRPAIP
jgi:hypothetical protein